MTLLQESRCPECGGLVTVWADNSDGISVNFECLNARCTSGKGPWDTPRPESGSATYAVGIALLVALPVVVFVAHTVATILGRVGL